MANIDSVAGPQPDSTQGIAKVEFKNADDSVIKVIPACAVYIPEDHNVIKYELNLHTSNEKSKYYIIGPWFKEVRPQGTFNKVTVVFYRYRKQKPKEFSFLVGSEFKKFESSNSFVIPCQGENFESSTFLKDWSCKVVLYKTPSNISSDIITASCWGFKNVYNKELKKNLFYYTKIDIKCTRNAQDFTIGKDEHGTLTESGLILFEDKPNHYNVVGCYKKGSSQIQISCLHSAEMLSVNVVNSQHQGEAVHQAENHAAAQTGNENAQQVQQQRAAPNGDISQTDNNHEAHAQPQGTPVDDSHPEQHPQPGNNSEEQSQRVAPGAVESDENNVNTESQPVHQVAEQDNLVPSSQRVTQAASQTGNDAQLQAQPLRVAPGAVEPDGNNTESQAVDQVAEQDNLVPPSQRVTQAASQTGNDAQLQAQPLRVAPGAVEPDGNNTESQAVDQVAEQDNLVPPSQRVTQAASQTGNDAQLQAQPLRNKPPPHPEELGVASRTIPQMNNPALQLQLLEYKQKALQVYEEQSQRVVPGAVGPDGNNTASQPQPNRMNQSTEQDNSLPGNNSEEQSQRPLAPGAIQPDGNNTASQPQPNGMDQSTEHPQELGVASRTIRQMNNPTLQLQLLTDKLQQQRLASAASQMDTANNFLQQSVNNDQPDSSQALEPSPQGVAVGGDAHSSDSSRMNTAGVQEGQPPYTKEALIEFYQQLASHISTDYMKVGRWLGLTNHELKNIDDRRSPENKVYEMFMKWKEIKGTEATPQVLAKALLQSGRRDLADDKDLAIYKVTYTQEGFNTFLNKLSPKIVNIWKKVGRCLGIEEYMLVNIEHDVNKAPEEKAYEMLMKWRETKAAEATLELLAEALKKSERRRLATAVVEFEKTGDIKFPN